MFPTRAEPFGGNRSLLGLPNQDVVSVEEEEDLGLRGSRPRRLVLVASCPEDHSDTVPPLQAPLSLTGRSVCCL